MSDVALEFCSRSDSRYKAIRDRHYVPNKGSHGQQVHFLIWWRDALAGIISGGSAVYSVACRDEFFGIPKDKRLREQYWLPAIVNNTVFRLEIRVPNLGSRVLTVWKRAVRETWKQLYNVTVLGFETFIVEEAWRVGSVYRASNWSYLGKTTGRTKAHTTKGGLADARAHCDTQPKLVYACWAMKQRRSPKTPYVSSWRRRTSEEKRLDKQLQITRKSLLGRRFT